MSSILFIATEWNESQGGINVFNRDLATNCGILCKDRYDITCLVINSNDVEIESALKNGIRLIPLRQSTSIESLDPKFAKEVATFLAHNNIRPAFIVGHDIFSGPLAISLAKDINSHSVIFVHTNYAAYKASQDGGDGTRSNEKETLQENVVRQANYVYGIGPLLTDAARDMDGSLSIKRKKRIRNFIPGMPEIEPLDISKNFSAITFGRYGDRNEIVKQQYLAIAAYAEFFRQTEHKVYPKRLTIVGLSRETNEKNAQIEKLHNLIETYSGSAINISPHGFIPQDEAWKLLRKSSVSMMLSWHEGFGLAGWEAIAAGVPLILSEDSGLYQFLDSKYDHLGACYWPTRVRGRLDGDINDADVDTVSRILSQMFEKRERIRSRALVLRQELLRTYKWRRRARAFIKSLDSKAFRFDPIRKNKVSEAA